MNTAGRGTIEYQKTIEVDGQEFKVVLLSPTRAVKISIKLTKLIGEPMAALAATGGGDMTALAQMLPMAVRALTQRLDENEVIEIMKALVSSCTIQNRTCDFEQDFQGRIGTLIRLVAKVAEVQCGDFFVALAESLAQAMGRQQATA